LYFVFHDDPYCALGSAEDEDDGRLASRSSSSSCLVLLGTGGSLVENSVVAIYIILCRALGLAYWLTPVTGRWVTDGKTP
jgi:hypothetical protein